MRSAAASAPIAICRSRPPRLRSKCKKVSPSMTSVGSHDRPRGLPAGHHRRLDAFNIEAAVDPGAGEKEMGKPRTVGGQTPSRRTRRRTRTAGPGIDVGLYDLVVDPILARCFVGVEQQIPVEWIPETGGRPQHLRLLLEPFHS